MKYCKVCKKSEEESPFKKNGGLRCYSCFKEYCRNSYHQNLDKQRLRGREKYKKYSIGWNKKNKEKMQIKKCLIYNHYGNKCACCGETIMKFLTIDHVNNDGNLSKYSSGKRKSGLYELIIKNNFPDSYRILCYNCNCGRARNHNICPHKEQFTL